VKRAAGRGRVMLSEYNNQKKVFMSVYLSITGTGQPDELTAMQQAIRDHATLEAWYQQVRIKSYSIDLPQWNPNRKDWANDEGTFRLESHTDDQGNDIQALAFIHADQLMVDGLVDEDGPVPVHFLDGLRQLYPNVALSMDAVLTDGYMRKRWEVRNGRTRCVEKMCPCWDSQPVRYWMKDGKVLIRRGKPVADELPQHARFIVVRGHPVAEGEGELKPVEPYKAGCVTVRTAFVTDKYPVLAHGIG